MTRSHTDEPRPGDVLSIDLDILDKNPFQPRTEMDPTELEGLKASLDHSGQLQPIAVRPNGPGRYHIIAGHRRAAAFRLLLAAATTESERRRWALIRAHVVATTTDSEMAIAAYVENAARSNLSPLDEAAALARISEMGCNLSAPEVAKITGQPERRVRRMLRLNEAPQVVKDAVTAGVKVNVAAAGQPPRNETRKLEFFAALEFMRLHEHHQKKKPAAADDRTTTAIYRALSEGWSLKRVQKYVDGVVQGRPGREGEEGARGLTAGPNRSGSGHDKPPAEPAPLPASSPESESTDAASPLTATTAAGFLLRVSRLQQASADQLRTAREALEKVLDAIDDQLKSRPTPDASRS